MKKLLLLSSLAMATLGVNAATLIDGLYYDLDGTNATVVKSESSDVVYTGDIVVPAEVTSGDNTYTVNAVGEGAFQNTTVTSVSLPDGSFTVNANAFDTATLTSLHLGNGINLLADAVTAGCTSLTDIYCSASGFGKVPSITDESIPASIRPNIVLNVPAGNAMLYILGKWTDFKYILYNNQVVDNNLFYQVDETNHTATLLSLYYDVYQDRQIDSVNPFQHSGALTIPSTVTSADGTVYTVTTIKANALDLRSGNLTSVTFSEGLTTINANALYGQQYLTEATLPSTLTSMDIDVFSSCPAMSKLTCYAVTPPKIYAGTFDTTNYSNTTLYVPKDAVDTYKAAANWSNFSRIEGVDVPEDKVSVSLTPTAITLTEKDQTYVLSYEITPAGTTDPISWSTSNPDVATVDNGTVTAVANGTCTITLTVGEATATCTVTVAIESGVADINIDANTPVRYFNLNGVEITNPAKGQVVIIRQGNKSVKAVMR